MNYAIISISILLLLLWYVLNIKEIKTHDDILVSNYSQKQSFSKRVVLIIETYSNLDDLLTLIRNILNQTFKVDSIILISKDETLKKIKLLHNTCIFNKIGGSSFIFKEGENNTKLLFIFSEGFKYFEQPYFLQTFLNSKNKVVQGINMVDTNLININIDNAYI